MSLRCVPASTGALKTSEVTVSRNLLSSVCSSSTNVKDLFSVHQLTRHLASLVLGLFKVRASFPSLGSGVPGPVKSCVSADNMLVAPVGPSSSGWLFLNQFTRVQRESNIAPMLGLWSPAQCKGSPMSLPTSGPGPPPPSPSAPHSLKTAAVPFSSVQMGGKYPQDKLMT